MKPALSPGWYQPSERPISPAMSEPTTPITMVTMILGGGVDTRVLPGWMHWGPAAIALYFNLVAFWRNAKYMMEQNMLWQELEGRLAPPVE